MRRGEGRSQRRKNSKRNRLGLRARGLPATSFHGIEKQEQPPENSNIVQQHPPAHGTPKRVPHDPEAMENGACRHGNENQAIDADFGMPVDQEQGVSKSGNPRLRTTLIQLAWLWLRHQPQSALTLWFEARAKRNGGRFKKTTIVALARKLLVALWKYVTAGVMIEGAAMKTA